MTIYVLPKWQRTELPAVDVTSHGARSRMLSPFLLGPVMLYGGMWSRNMENAWQYAKVYPVHAHDAAAYFRWARSGWSNQRAQRYPMGKGAIPCYSLWAGERFGYIEARKRIYAPLYAQAVRFYALDVLRGIRAAADVGDIAILDYDAYDHRALGYSWDDVMNDPGRKMGHGFVLAMMLEGVL